MVHKKYVAEREGFPSTPPQLEIMAEREGFPSTPLLDNR
jgi:hypothetical protein